MSAVSHGGPLLRGPEATVTVRRTKTLRMQGFYLKHRHHGFGVHTSHMGTWTLGARFL